MAYTQTFFLLLQKICSYLHELRTSTYSGEFDEKQTNEMRALLGFRICCRSCEQNTPDSSSFDASDMLYRDLCFESLPLHWLSWFLMIPLFNFVGFWYSILKQAIFNSSKMHQSPPSLLTHAFLRRIALVVDVELFSTYQSTETRWLQVECVRKFSVKCFISVYS
jgi:hypothetical protein